MKCRQGFNGPLGKPDHFLAVWTFGKVVKQGLRPLRPGAPVILADQPDKFRFLGLRANGFVHDCFPSLSSSMV